VDGLRTETFTGGGLTGQLSAILVGPAVYVRGNFVGLVAFMQFTDTAATNEAGHWIWVSQKKPSQTLDYLALSSGMTVSSIISQLQMSGPLTLTSPTTVQGQAVLGIKGKRLTNSGVTEVLYVSANGTPLPVEMVSTYNGETATLVFSLWDKAPAATAPAHPVPLKASWISAT
jgi:hypothetical protein